MYAMSRCYVEIHVFIITFSAILSDDVVYFFLITVHLGWRIYYLYWILRYCYCVHDNDVGKALHMT